MTKQRSWPGETLIVVGGFEVGFWDIEGAAI